ncbi:MAG: Crp/Fnr family transcriptional regulator [Cyclobacteriaceae bacterium]|nr:Crp/Fnr family transcriptional regulator [Cyclobacteriaceae bacterium]
MLKELKDIINTIFPISDAALNEIVALVEYKTCRKGDVFLETGKRNQKEYFLLKGICRSFLFSPEGEEITISFFNTGSVLSPFVTRTIKGTTNMNFQALTDITLGEMDANKFEMLMVNNLEIREFGNMVLKSELKKKVEKEINLASLTALDRLKIFRSDYPGFENIVPHPTIATFLGITNVSLSRLRKNKA